jgi:hypothetical protein
MHPQLAKTLALQKHPVVVPPGEQLPAANRLRRHHTVNDSVRVQHPLGPVPELTDIDAHATGQSQGTTGDLHQSRHGLLNAPQRRPEAAVGVILRDIWPELAGHSRPGGAAVETEMGDQSLRATREVGDDSVHATGTAFEREAIQQPDARFRGRVHGVSPLVASY